MLIRPGLRLFLGVCLLGVPSAGGAQPTDVDARVSRLVQEVSEARLQALLTHLASFDTRFLLSDPDPQGRGIGAARQWIFDELTKASPRLQVSFDTYQVAAQGQRIGRPVELRNVVAVLPGRSARRLYVGGHYDSVARIEPPAGAAGTAEFRWDVPDNPAPGANDDGSGTVLAMELARVFARSGLEFDATLVFIAFAGEEQGLIGAALHAARAAGEDTVIDALLNNDIVGGVVDGQGFANAQEVRVFAEGPEDSPSRQLARHVRKTAARYVPAHRIELVARHDRFGRGGDHTAFNQHGFAAVRFTEAAENYARQHTVLDTVDGVSFPYLAQNARVNAAALATLALSPRAPAVVTERGAPMLGREPSGYDARLRWHPAEGAAAYRVYWRRAWAMDWEHSTLVGAVTEYALPNVSIDAHVFGVSAVGADGLESLVSAYVNPPRPPIAVETVPDR